MASRAANLFDLSPTQKLLQSLKAGKPLGDIISLIKKGANVFAIDKDGRTVLHYAAAGGNQETLAYLVETHQFELDIRAKTKKKKMPVHFAVWAGHIEAAEYLIQGSLPEGAKMDALGKEDSAIPASLPIDDMTLFDAAEGGHPKMVKHLIFRYSLNPHIQDKHGETLLFRAVRFNRIEILRYLTAEQGLDPHATNSTKRTLLHYAAYYGCFEAFKVLTSEYRLDMRAQDSYGCTPLHKAAEKGHVEIIQYLLSESEPLNVNVRDKEGNTPLHYAISSSNESEVIERLLALGADVDAKNKRGQTIFNIVPEDSKLKAYLLHYAVFSQESKTIERLLNEGADVNVRNKMGQTIFDIVPQDSELKEYLFEKMLSWAEAGNTELQFKLGEMFLLNEPNNERTYHFLKSAAAKEHAIANCYLGIIHEYGLCGVPVSFRDAGTYYTQAYQNIFGCIKQESAGHVNLIYLLTGVHCLMGTLNDPLIKAADSFAKVERVKKISENAIAEIEEIHKIKEIPEKERRSVEGIVAQRKLHAAIEESLQQTFLNFFAKRAEEKHLSAYLLLAMVHAGGVFGTQQNSILAEQYLSPIKRAIDAKLPLPFNVATLCANIAKMYESGLWLSQDLQRAAAWRRCAEEAKKGRDPSNSLTINAIRAYSSKTFPNDHSFLSRSSSSSTASGQPGANPTAAKKDKDGTGLSH